MAFACSTAGSEFSQTITNGLSRYHRVPGDIPFATHLRDETLCKMIIHHPSTFFESCAVRVSLSCPHTTQKIQLEVDLMIGILGWPPPQRPMCEVSSNFPGESCTHTLHRYIPSQESQL